jgi:hypothetical protein
MTGGIVGVSCFCIAAGLYTLVRGQLPPLFIGTEGFAAPDVPPSAVRRWGVGLLAFGVLLGVLAWLSLSVRHA